LGTKACGKVAIALLNLPGGLVGDFACDADELCCVGIIRIRPAISVVDTVLKKRLGKEQRSATGLDPDSGSELGNAIYRKVSQAW
jgi:hypothetical protein